MGLIFFFRRIFMLYTVYIFILFNVMKMSLYKIVIKTFLDVSNIYILHFTYLKKIYKV